MTRRRFARGLGVTLLALLALTAGAHARTHIDPAAPPSAELQRWALEALEAARLGQLPPDAPGDWTPPADDHGPMAIVTTAWMHGVPLRTIAHRGTLTEAVAAASAELGADPELPEDPAWTSGGPGRARFTVEVPLGRGPLVPELPWVQELGLVPLHEGLGARHGEDEAYVMPEELRASGAYDGGVTTPIPDLAFGAPVPGLIGRLGRQLGLDGREALLAQGEVFRVRSFAITEASYPADEEVTEENLRRASVEGAEFLLRHQHRDGRWTYVYDGATGSERREAYNLPRHSGTTYFVAQVDRLHGLPAARAGALRALRWLQRNKVRRCGDHPCIESYGRADIGSAALTVVAATEVLAKEDDRVARELAEGLTAFIRSQQRPDGELMHEYDLRAQEPIDIQHMYYSGEAAFALLKAHEVLGNEADLEAARQLMSHLTGSGWDFLGSRYYYGEEHWTCIAAGEAAGRVDSPEALDFCRRWFEFNDNLQYREGETPWPVEGAYGAGPVIVPRLTPVGSRTEAFINTYLLFQHHGADTTEIRALIERGLGQLLRYRWAPGPTHLLANPRAAQGGMPGSPVDLTSRNDFVQHAGSAWIRWAEVLRSERE